MTDRGAILLNVLDNKTSPLDRGNNIDFNGANFILSISVVETIICVVGLAGNLLVFYVVCRYTAMHTVTNVFILALALADIAFLGNVPLLVATSILGNWPFGDLYCKIYYSVSTINQFASSFFLVVMSADRYCAVCHPLWSRRVRTTPVAILICCIIWAVAIALMYPVFKYSGETSHENSTAIGCSLVWPDSETLSLTGSSGFALYCFVLGYGLPIALMVTFYGLVLQRLRLNHAKIQLSSARDRHVESASSQKRRVKLRRVTMMILVLILVYLFCWTPYWVLQLYIVFSANEADSVAVIITCLSLQCLCFANSSVNPFLYFMLSDNFKKSYVQAFKRTFSSKIPGATSPLLVIQAPSYGTSVRGIGRRRSRASVSISITPSPTTTTSARRLSRTFFQSPFSAFTSKPNVPVQLLSICQTVAV